MEKKENRMERIEIKIDLILEILKEVSQPKYYYASNKTKPLNSKELDKAREEGTFTREELEHIQIALDQEDSFDMDREINKKISKLLNKEE